MNTTNEKIETGCCEKLNPEPWNEKEIKLENKLFLKEHICCAFYIPMNFGKVMERAMNKIQAANANAAEFLMLYECKRPFKANIYIAIDNEVPNSETKRISGKFLTKVFEGSYNNMGKWMKEMQEFAKSRDKKIKNIYYYYATCPKCAKIYGKNYTVILAEI